MIILKIEKFFLLLFFSYVYANLADLRNRIVEEIEQLLLKIISRAFEDFRRRLQICLNRQGRSVETR